MSDTMTTRNLRVLLSAEGTYPYHSGGVSTWCDNLIKGLPEIDFILFPIMMNPYISIKYDMPPNVKQIIRVPLWGTEEPAEYILEIPFSHLYLSKKRTTTSVISRFFLPLLQDFLRILYASSTDAQRLGELLLEMHQYFQEFDYNTTFKARVVWDTFVEAILEQTHAANQTESPYIYDLTESLRWLYRFLIPLNAVPPKVDLTHSTASAFCGIPCVLTKLRDRTPMLLTEHGVYIREQYLAVSRMNTSYHAKNFLLNLVVAISRLNYHFADQISPVCAYNRRWEEAHGAAPDKIKVIHNGVDPQRFSPREEAARDKATIIVTPAAIGPLKDIETLILAADLVRREEPGVQFLVYGSIADQEYYDRCIALRDRLGLQKVVIFPGLSTTPWDIYNDGDIMALTSISEAFPYAVIEAMSCGKPVVATDVGGVREALEGCGVLVPPRRPEEFAASLVTLLRDPSGRVEMGQDARNRVLDVFTLHRFADEYRKSYHELCDTGRIG